MKFNDEIHNVYEQLVIEHISQLEISNDEDYLADLVCLTLNQLSPRYIRHDVDMAYYQPTSERQRMLMEVADAVRRSLSFLKSHRIEPA